MWAVHCGAGRVRKRKKSKVQSNTNDEILSIANVSSFLVQCDLYT